MTLFGRESFPANFFAYPGNLVYFVIPVGVRFATIAAVSVVAPDNFFLMFSRSLLISTILPDIIMARASGSLLMYSLIRSSIVYFHEAVLLLDVAYELNELDDDPESVEYAVSELS